MRPHDHQIPKYSKSLREVSIREAFNPIRPKTIQSGEIMVLSRPIMFNYGSFPRTWFSPSEDYIGMGVGNNDHLDCVEIGLRAMQVIIDTYSNDFRLLYIFIIITLCFFH